MELLGHGVNFVVAFGILVNVVMIVACLATMAWIRRTSAAKKAIRQTKDASCNTTTFHPSAKKIVFPAVADVDTQIMLMSSANVEHFFGGRPAAAAANHDFLISL